MLHSPRTMADAPTVGGPVERHGCPRSPEAALTLHSSRAARWRAYLPPDAAPRVPGAYLPPDGAPQLPNEPRGSPDTPIGANHRDGAPTCRRCSATAATRPPAADAAPRLPRAHLPPMQRHGCQTSTEAVRTLHSARTSADGAPASRSGVPRPPLSSAVTVCHHHPSPSQAADRPYRHMPPASPPPPSAAPAPSATPYRHRRILAACGSELALTLQGFGIARDRPRT
jgi:hypothetical protein